MNTSSHLKPGAIQHPQGVAMQATCIQPKAGQDRLRRWVPRCLRQDRPKGERLAVSPLRGYAATLSQRGFTLVELVMTIILVGILAAYATTSFKQTIFQSRGFADQVQAALRYAQKEAIAQRRNVCVAFTLPAPSTVTLTVGNAYGVACNTGLAFPAGGNVLTAPAGIAFTALPTAFSFDTLGRPNPNAAQTISIVGATNSITVEAETGYVHQ